ncbi:uncharacterized protein FIESC28_00349 [Fusarium coffeatum]|uniref:Ubiquitin-like domain-containing protein n=1 Tax=Fusarium coffeatum TaxID=231269 RepID=A0A366SCY7_9HYPO|nr:uncharacterized protein FIESC28_00349 [Fusarium coffeatum]RBR26768.1 hypothetical protein FIESC28_00349 [Fusarium coffeatum]
MEFGLTFGAVGDFIAITVLIKDIIKARNDARGSAKEYRELVRELDTLHLTLEAVQKTCEDPHLTDSLEDLTKIALDTVSHVKDCSNGFLDLIRKYEPILGAVVSGKSNSFKAIGRKIQWKLNEREIEKFRAEVMGCTMALNVLLEVITVRMLQRNHDTLAKEQTAAEGRTAALIRRSEASLKAWISFIGRQILRRLQIVHRSGIELKRSIDQIIAMMCTLSGDLSSIRAIVMHLDRGPSDEYFILEDVTGRTFPIHLRTITSWAVLEFILNERFKGKKGARRVQRKLYSLRESNTQREIDGSMPWESAFLPRQKITMSLICKDAENNNAGGRVSSSCPFCQTPSDHDSGGEVECAKCKRLRNSAPSPGRRKREHDSNSTKTCSICHSSRRHDTGTISKRKCCLSGTDSETDSDDGDVQGFVRVHLVSRKRRATTKVPNQGEQERSAKLKRMREAERSSVNEVVWNNKILHKWLSETSKMEVDPALIGVDPALGRWLSISQPPTDLLGARKRTAVNYRGTSTFGEDDSDSDSDSNSEGEDGTSVPLVVLCPDRGVSVEGPPPPSLPLMIPFPSN